MADGHVGLKLGPASHGATEDEVVEFFARDDQRSVGAADGGRGAAAIRRHHLVTVDTATVRRHLSKDAHAVEHAQRARRQAVAAGFVSRKLGPVEQEHVETAFAQEVRRG